MKCSIRTRATSNVEHRKKIPRLPKSIHNNRIENILEASATSPTVEDIASFKCRGVAHPIKCVIKCFSEHNKLSSEKIGDTHPPNLRWVPTLKTIFILVTECPCKVSKRLRLNSPVSVQKSKPLSLQARISNQVKLWKCAKTTQKRSNSAIFQGTNLNYFFRNAKHTKSTFWAIVHVFNELRYPLSNLFKLSSWRIFQLSFKSIWKTFLDLSHGQASSYGQMHGWTQVTTTLLLHLESKSEMNLKTKTYFEIADISPGV